MGFDNWFVVAAYGLVALTFGRLLPLLYRIGRRDPKLRWFFRVWATLVALTATVPILTLATRGHLPFWYGWAVSMAVIAIAVGSLWTQRRRVWQIFRHGTEPPPPG